MRGQNVLLFIADHQRWDTLGYTGRSPCRTLDRLARGGVAIDRCLTPDPICSPARAALFTGRCPHSTGVMNNHQLPLEQAALPAVFRQAGYHVAYSGKWHLGRGRAFQAFGQFAGEGMTDTRCIVGPRFKYAWNRGQREELYDTWADPAELRNRAAAPALAGIRGALRHRRLAWMRETGDAVATATDLTGA